MSSHARFRSTARAGSESRSSHLMPDTEHPETSPVPALCAALDHSDVETRIRAAKALGEIGDERAIGPLTAALADLSEARYAGVRRHRMAARVTAFFAVGSAVLGALFSAGHPSFFPMASGLDLGDGLTAVIVVALLLGFAAFLISRHRPDPSRPRALAAFADALGELALRHPSPDLRAALEDLTASRAAAGRASAEWLPTIDRAIERIEEATAELQQLPLPSEQAGTPLPELPLPATGIADATATRPRPSGPRHDL